MHANMQRKAARKNKQPPTNNVTNTINTTNANNSYTYGKNTYKKPTASINAVTHNMQSPPSFHNAENTAPHVDTQNTNTQQFLDSCISFIHNLKQHARINAIAIVNNMQTPNTCTDNQDMGTH